MKRKIGRSKECISGKVYICYRESYNRKSVLIAYRGIICSHEDDAEATADDQQPNFSCQPPSGVGLVCPVVTVAGRMASVQTQPWWQWWQCGSKQRRQKSGSMGLSAWKLQEWTAKARQGTGGQVEEEGGLEKRFWSCKTNLDPFGLKVSSG